MKTEIINENDINKDFSILQKEYKENKIDDLSFLISLQRLCGRMIKAQLSKKHLKIDNLCFAEVSYDTAQDIYIRFLKGKDFFIDCFSSYSYWDCYRNLYKNFPLYRLEDIENIEMENNYE